MKKLLILPFLFSAFHTVFAQHIIPPENAKQLDTLRNAKKKQVAADGYSHKITSRELFEGLSWLEGTWTNTDSSGKILKQENWVKTAPYMLSGSRYTLSGKDTTNKQQCSFLFELWLSYVVYTDSADKSIFYDISYINNSTGFILEKAGDAFPKKIIYAKIGPRLRITLSGGGHTESYLFERKKDPN